MLNGLVKGFTNAMAKAGRVIVKHAPTIAFVGGAAAVGFGVYKVATASRTIDEKMEEPVAKLDEIKEKKENATEEAPYTDKEYRRDLRKAYLGVAKVAVKEYGVAAICLVGGMAAMGGAHISLVKANGKLAGALTASTAAYAGLRKQLDKLGPGVEQELLYDLQNKEVDVVKGEDAEGNAVTEKQNVPTVASDVTRCSPYAIFFDSSCAEWEPSAEYNKTFLHQVEAEATRKLKARGYLFLNEVYRMLGAKETEIGQYVGWIYDEVNPVGDNYVDLGMFDAYNEASRRFVNGYESVIILDPNVDGEIVHICFS